MDPRLLPGPAGGAVLVRLAFQRAALVVGRRGSDRALRAVVAGLRTLLGVLAAGERRRCDQREREGGSEQAHADPPSGPRHCRARLAGTANCPSCAGRCLSDSVRAAMADQISARVDRLELPFDARGVDDYGVSKWHLAVVFRLLALLYRNYFHVRAEG